MRRGYRASSGLKNRLLRLSTGWTIAAALLMQLVLAGPFELLRGRPTSEMLLAGAAVCGGSHAAPDGRVPAKPSCDHQGCVVCQAWAGPLAPPPSAGHDAVSFHAEPAAPPPGRNFASRTLVGSHSPRGPPRSA
jgi:hypothetical protein